METISDIDIQNVAKALNIKIIDGMIDFVKNNFDGESRNDPTATWDLIVENLLYQF